MNENDYSSFSFFSKLQNLFRLLNQLFEDTPRERIEKVHSKDQMTDSIKYRRAFLEEQITDMKARVQFQDLRKMESAEGVSRGSPSRAFVLLYSYT